MAKKAPPKKKAAQKRPAFGNARKAPPAPAARKKSKMPTLGGGLMGLGGTGAQGMMP
jgi:hypothetical protein